MSNMFPSDITSKVPIHRRLAAVLSLFYHSEPTRTLPFSRKTRNKEYNSPAPRTMTRGAFLWVVQISKMIVRLVPDGVLSIQSLWLVCSSGWCVGQGRTQFHLEIWLDHKNVPRIVLRGGRFYGSLIYSSECLCVHTCPLLPAPNYTPCTQHPSSTNSLTRPTHSFYTAINTTSSWLPQPLHQLWPSRTSILLDLLNPCGWRWRWRASLGRTTEFPSANSPPSSRVSLYVFRCRVDETSWFTSRHYWRVLSIITHWFSLYLVCSLHRHLR